MEMKLLELSAEYAEVKIAIESDPFTGEGHRSRTLEQIAEEYGAALKEFLRG